MTGPSRPFRLRAQAVLLTYNSATLDVSDFGAFTSWLETAEWGGTWTATLESSLCSADPGRLHLHAFVEFRRLVDWTSADALQFKGIRPNIAPCRARGPHYRQTADCGHFYVYAAKAAACRLWAK